MAGTYLSLQEAADLSGKSLQTLRRAVKAKKLSCRKQKTPQGFNYLVERESVIKTYKLRIDLSDRKSAGLKKTQGKGGSGSGQSSFNADLLAGYAKLEDVQRLQGDMHELLSEHKKAKESFMRFMKAFQERFVVLENQMKVLEAPQEKRWYQFWK